MSNYTPFIKPIGFCPNPVAKYGIPAYADSSIRKEVVGSSSHQKWWEEQLYYCINGYDTAGVFIPGRYYYYLNFFMMSTVGRGTHYPNFIDLDYEFFLLVEQVKKERKGIISAKARRKGLSYKVVGGIFDYGFRFQNKYEAGIAAGLQDHADDFYQKFRDAQSLKAPEFRMNLITDNSHDTESGYEIKENGLKIIKGMRNKIYCRTMNDNPNVFKGKKLEDCVFEEAGEFDLLVEAFNASRPCFMAGKDMIGTPYIYGTGGNMERGSKGFMKMWTEHESFGLEKFLVPASRLYMPYYGGSLDEFGKSNEIIPNLKHIPEEQRLGCEDVKAAESYIQERRKMLLKKGDLRTYYDELQNYPLTEKEIFLKFKGNDFNFEKLNHQMFTILSTPKKYKYYKLDWAKDENGKIKIPHEVIATVVEEQDLELGGNICYVKIIEHPIGDINALDIAGIDSYDIDTSRTSKSLGSMVVFRRHNNIPYKMKKAPVALIRNRPKRKEIFYETCVKLAVYYKMEASVLIDIAKPLIISHFENLGLSRYLSERPRSIESIDSAQVNKYGFNFNNQSKPQFISITQTWIEDCIHDCWFEEIIQDLLDYDINSKDSDCDSADALGIALIKDLDMKYYTPLIDVKEQEDPWALPSWVDDGDGNPVLYNQNAKKEKQSTVDLFLQSIIKDYE